MYTEAIKILFRSKYPDCTFVNDVSGGISILTHRGSLGYITSSCGYCGCGFANIHDYDIIKKIVYKYLPSW